MTATNAGLAVAVKQHLKDVERHRQDVATLAAEVRQNAQEVKSIEVIEKRKICLYVFVL